MLTDTQTGHITTQDGVRLHYKRWPLSDARGTVLIIHGYADHSGRYGYTAAALRDMGLESFAIDLRGHGASPGPRGFIENFDEYLIDMDAGIELAGRELGQKPLFILGHSMGGLITFRHIISREDTFRGVILSSPFFGIAQKVPTVKHLLGSVMSSLYPRLALANGINPEDVSHDPRVVNDYMNDPLVFKTATARWYTEALRVIAEAERDARKFLAPVLVLQAGQDRLANPSVIPTMYSQFGSFYKELRDYPDFYHEVLNERERERVYSDIREWVDSRINIED